MYVDENKGCTDLFLRSCESCGQNVQRCCAVHDAMEMMKSKSWTLHVWRACSKGRRCTFKLKQWMLKKRADLLLRFYVYVTFFCKNCKSVVRLKTQCRWRKTNLEFGTSEDNAVRVKSARLNLSDVCWWRERIYWSVSIFISDLCVRSAAKLGVQNALEMKKGRFWMLKVWRS